MSLLFDIKRYGINDGPGIRISLFFKGCPLSCVWCHNPEGISSEQEKLYARSRCIGCGLCIKHCKQQALTLTPEGVVTTRERCTLCGACTAICPTKAMELSGRAYSTAQLIEEIEKERPFMEQSGGGVTLCGGEPLMQLSSLTPLLEYCGQVGIHRAIDSSLYASPKVVARACELCDLFLVDLKQMNSTQHKEFCGVPNEQILDNLRLIAHLQKEFYIRIPLVEGFNCDAENIAASIDFLLTLSKRPTVVNLLAYHDVGKVKHEKLGTTYNPKGYSFSAPSQERQQEIVNQFKASGLEATLGG